MLDEEDYYYIVAALLLASGRLDDPDNPDTRSYDERFRDFIKRSQENDRT